MPAIRKSSTAWMLAGVLALGTGADAYAVPWIQYADAESGSLCEIVNAANLELVVLDFTGELAGVTGTDVVFEDTFVDDDGLVFYFGDPAGFIEFAEDADGFRTLWWFTEFNDVADVDEFTGEPFSSGLLPFDFGDVPCDACPFWDFPEECTDSDGDGVEDAFDSCPDTPLDLLADVEDDGCACAELDGDLDGINACFDLCADTPFDEIADIDGCSCSQLDDDRDGVVNCFDLCSGTSQLDAVDFDGCAIIVSGGGGISLSFCGSINAMLLGVMVMGLVGFRRLPRRWEATGLQSS